MEAEVISEVGLGTNTAWFDTFAKEAEFMSKKVLCSECGFLCWYVQHESGEGPVSIGTVRRSYRKKFQSGEAKGRNEVYDPDNQETCDLGCLRSLWRWAYSREVNSESVDAEELRKSRYCSYYIKYEPAYTPEEHKELQREQQTNRMLRNATLLGAAVGGAMGAAGAIAAQLIYAVVTS